MCVMFSGSLGISPMECVVKELDLHLDFAFQLCQVDLQIQQWKEHLLQQYNIEFEEINKKQWFV